ncbi:hypothetical protein CMO88_00010 [Candidatus Woesearchaeota archaeon]|nr:hypothetical protein [Candidatus Woesearchaeota archaeon]
MELKLVILFDQYHLPENVYEIIFATNQQRIVAKVLIDSMKEKKGEMNKTEMSFFATKLHDGELVTEIDEPQYKGKKVKLSYNKRQFYDRILTPMKTMGLIDYDMYKKTYKISEAFNRELIKIGLLWQREARKPVSEFKLKKK